MLFSSGPKDDVRALFGRDKEIGRLRSAVRGNDPLVVITGLRRTGKTSLVRSVLAEHPGCVVWLDMRDLEGRSQVAKGDIVGLLEGGVAEFLERNAPGREKILAALRTVRGTRVDGAGVDLGWPDKKALDMGGLFRRLDGWAGSNGARIIVLIDGAQELAKARHAGMNSVFASVYDNCRNTMLVITGSGAGLLRDFLALEDPDLPLFGRDASFIDLKPLSASRSAEFLRLGFEEMGAGTSGGAEESIRAAASELGGVMGWLNLFGLECARTGNVGAAELGAVRAAGARLAKAGFRKFLSARTARGRYESIMRGMRPGGTSWRSLRGFVRLDLGEAVHDKNFCDLLGVLVKAGFVARDGGGMYSIADPLLRHAYR